jgi:hypothetical protein
MAEKRRKMNDEMLGRVVLKRFPKFPKRLFVGIVVRKLYDGSLFRVHTGTCVSVSYDEKDSLYKIKYEDGDQEDMDKKELCSFLSISS